MCCSDEATTFKITSTKLHVPIATLSTKNNVNLTKQLNKRFKRSVYWNEYKCKIETMPAKDQTFTRFSLDASSQVNRLFVLAFNNTTLDNCNMDLVKLKETVIEIIFSQE